MIDIIQKMFLECLLVHYCFLIESVFFSFYKYGPKRLSKSSSSYILQKELNWIDWIDIYLYRALSQH